MPLRHSPKRVWSENSAVVFDLSGQLSTMEILGPSVFDE